MFRALQAGRCDDSFSGFSVGPPGAPPHFRGLRKDPRLLPYLPLSWLIDGLQGILNLVEAKLVADDLFLKRMAVVSSPPWLADVVAFLFWVCLVEDILHVYPSGGRLRWHYEPAKPDNGASSLSCRTSKTLVEWEATTFSLRILTATIQATG